MIRSLSGILISYSNEVFSISRYRQHYFWSAGYVASVLVSPIPIVILVKRNDGVGRGLTYLGQEQLVCC